MGSHQHYNLSWGEFGTSLASTMKTLRDHNEMVDVTLAAGGRIFSAHRLVLSAASPLLMELLKSTHCQHPVLMLAGITAPDLEALLHFVYQGEVNVDSSQLPSLLQAAHCLDIQALSPKTLTTEKTMAQVSVPVVMTNNLHELSTRTNSSSRDKSVTAQPQTSRDLSPLMPVRKRKRKQSQSSETDSVKWGMTESAGVVVPVEGQQLDQVGGNHIEDTKDGILNEQQSSGEPEPPTPAEAKLRCASEQPCICSLCGLTIRQARNLRRHMLTSCHRRPLPDIEYQFETPEMYLPTIELLPNLSQEELVHRQSSFPPKFGPKLDTVTSKSPSRISQTSTSDLP